MPAALALLLAAAAVPSATAGYPKLFRCQSAIERPTPLPGYSPGCLAYREQELAGIRALPLRERRRRVAELRRAIGVPPGEGLVLSPKGDLRAAAGAERR